MWSCKPMWHCKYSVILESKVQFGEKYMKMSKCENSLFPYFLHSAVSLPAWRPKDTNVTLVSFLRLFTETSTPERKSFFQNFRHLLPDNYFPKDFFFQNLCQILSKLTKSVRNCLHPILWRNHQNWNLSFRNFLLKYETRINDKDLHDQEQKICTNLFYFYFLKELT